MPSDLIPGWKPVRVKTTRQIGNLEPGFDSIETGSSVAPDITSGDDANGDDASGDDANAGDASADDGPNDGGGGASALR
jgi:hypothetical protein